MTHGNDADGLARLRELFREPPRDFSPTPLWWWSAEPITRAELRRQLLRLHEGGVYNVVVINLAPSGPLFGAVVDDPIWFSDEWFERFTELCDEAESLGMRVWFYDQIGFSGANIQGKLTQQDPEAKGKTLDLAEIELGADSRPESQGVRLDRVVGIYSLPSDDAPHGRRLTVDAAGSLGVDHAGETVRVISWRPTAFDYLDPHAVGLLMDFVHGEFERRLPERLGKVIAGSFQDELPATNAWTNSFADGFRESFGYDLLEVLPAVFRPAGDEGARILHDYYTHRSALTERALFAPLGEWHRRYDMLIGSDQFNPARAGWPTQATQLYSDYFRTHRHYNAAGSDHEGDSKVHSSMAHLYDNPRTWLESFHSSGWGGTLQDTYDWLLPFLRSGANLYNPHAVYYSTVGGWFEWAPPSTDWRQPYWGQYKTFADCVARITSILSWGRHECHVAVLYPSATSQSTLALDSHVDHFGSGQLGAPFEAADLAQSTYLALAGTNNWWRTNPGVLNEAAIDFDVIDDASVQDGSLGEKSLRAGAESYSTVVVPSSPFFEEATAARLIELLDAGGRVIVVGTLPTAAAGTRGDDLVVERLREHPRLETVATADEAAILLAGSEVIGSSLASLVRTDDAGTSVAFVPAAQPNASAYPLRKDEGWFWEDFDFDASRYQPAGTVTLPATTRWAESWNPATGQQEPLSLTPHDGGVEVQLRFDGAPALLLLWGSEAVADSAGPLATPLASSRAGLARADADVLPLSDGWTMEAIPTLDNSHGEFDRPATDGPVAPAIWKIDVAETSPGDQPTEWTTTRATFGVHGEVAQPAAAGEHVFVPWAYSESRGIEKDATHRGQLGAKGRVPDAFVVTEPAGEGQTIRYRSVILLPEAGDYEFTLGASAAKRVWIDGRLVADDFELVDAPFLLRLPVRADADVVALEFELGRSQGAGTFMSSSMPSYQAASFSFAAPGALPSYPEYVRSSVVRERAAERLVVFRRDVDVTRPLRRARIVTGAATALGVYVDDVLIGRQEMAEYYETDWGASPQHFVHDLTRALTAGTHRIEVRCDTEDPQTLLVADLALEYADGTVEAVVTDSAWTVSVDGAEAPAAVTRSSWGESANTHLIRRPHALPAAEWLTGEPLIGSSATRFAASDSRTEREQWLRATLPAGVRSVTVPTGLAFRAFVDGSPVAVAQDATGTARIDLASALAAPAELRLVTEPTAFFRGGAVLAGPLALELGTAPADFRPWRDIGYDWLSGGMRYSRDLLLDEVASAATLDLGDLRGHVRVRVDGHAVADLFCTPWRVDLAPWLHEGTNHLEIELFNTLGPYMDDVSPTWWVFPSQKIDGLFGPISLRRPSSRGPGASAGA